MTKSRDRLIFGASRRSSRAQSEWKVDSQTRLAASPMSASTRSRISCDALLVNVTASTWSGSACPSPMRYAMRKVMTRVFPEPAPARISTGPSRWSTASRCSGFSLSRKSMGEFIIRRRRRRFGLEVRTEADGARADGGLGIGIGIRDRDSGARLPALLERRAGGADDHLGHGGSQNLRFLPRDACRNTTSPPVRGAIRNCARGIPR